MKAMPAIWFSLGVLLAGAAQAEWLSEEDEEPESWVSHPCPEIIISELSTKSKGSGSESVVYIHKDFRCVAQDKSKNSEKHQS